MSDTTTYEITVSAFRRQDFDAAITCIKNTAGKYDPDTKAWTITAEEGRTAIEEMDLYNIGGRVHYYTEHMTINEVETIDW